MSFRPWREVRRPDIIQKVTEAVINELGMGGLETGTGWSRGGDWGSSGWSRAWLAKDEDDADSTYQNSLRAPTRLVPFTHGVPDDHVPGEELSDDGQLDLNDPTDLSEEKEKGK